MGDQPQLLMRELTAGLEPAHTGEKEPRRVIGLQVGQSRRRIPAGCPAGQRTSGAAGSAAGGTSRPSSGNSHSSRRLSRVRPVANSLSAGVAGAAQARGWRSSSGVRRCPAQAAVADRPDSQADAASDQDATFWGAQRTQQNRGQQFRRGHRRQIGEPDAVRKPIRRGMAGLDGQAGFAHAARPQNRKQMTVRIGQPLGDQSKLAAAANEGVGWKERSCSVPPMRCAHSRRAGVAGGGGLPACRFPTNSGSSPERIWR